MVKLKRAAGAGRKPIGEFKDLTSVFSLRMPADLQKQVEIAAQRTGRSRSQEILRRLQNSFDAEREKTNPRALRAFFFLVSRINEIISNWEDGDWRNNPSFHQAFKSALLALLENLQPSKIMENEPSARKLGRNAANLIWEELLDPPDNSPLMDDIAAAFKLNPNRLRASQSYLFLKGKYQSIFYAYKNAKQDLRLASKGQTR